ncbi:hypothetical protein E0H75_22345 [Kribbella capetownensis]|uniref:Peptidase inhibitor family I36 n=1 Tax=Kribbella capetownensis TaxID=1572659 RepID=A0A4R0JMD2_9ACTN|nr:hypothetical protein [Kribbella capetownensis]TCC47520.1 hypothetical protein E0H75_22345 [Kribbella capetownensis]
MGIGKRTAALGLLASCLAVGATVTPADAVQKRPADEVVTAAAPTTSPAAAYRVYLPPGSGGGAGCDVGYACATVPYGKGYYWFKFYKYGTYTLHNWYGVGVTDNTQGFHAAMRILGANGREIGCEPPPVRDLYDWTPVYYIRLTAAPC